MNAPLVDPNVMLVQLVPTMQVPIPVLVILDILATEPIAQTLTNVSLAPTHAVGTQAVQTQLVPSLVRAILDTLEAEYPV